MSLNNALCTNILAKKEATLCSFYPTTRTYRRALWKEGRTRNKVKKNIKPRTGVERTKPNAKEASRANPEYVIINHEVAYIFESNLGLQENRAWERIPYLDVCKVVSRVYNIFLPTCVPSCHILLVWAYPCVLVPPLPHSVLNVLHQALSFLSQKRKKWRCTKCASPSKRCADVVQVHLEHLGKGYTPIRPETDCRIQQGSLPCEYIPWVGRLYRL
jgi:hypothetical protein